MPTRQQEWARVAYGIVNNRVRQGAGKEYRATCQSFPALIHGSGLCQALAFAESKSSGGRTVMGDYVQDLAEMLGSTDRDFRVKSRTADVGEYQLITRRSLAAAAWLKRYAEALVKSEERIRQEVRS